METEKTISEAYNKLLDKILNDEVYDLVIEYKDMEGKTIRLSWRERDKRLEEINNV